MRGIISLNIYLISYEGYVSSLKNKFTDIHTSIAFQYWHSKRGLKRVKQNVIRINYHLQGIRVYRYMIYVCILPIYLELLAADVLCCLHTNNRVKRYQQENGYCAHMAGSLIGNSLFSKHFYVIMFFKFTIKVQIAVW